MLDAYGTLFHYERARLEGVFRKIVEIQKLDTDPDRLFDHWTQHETAFRRRRVHRDEQGTWHCEEPFRPYDVAWTECFVTAFQEHAIRAFEANAVNYLMKPVDEDKLADTIERVRQRLAEKKSTEEAEKLKSVLSEVAPEAAENLAGEDPEAASRFEKLINVKDRGQIFRVEVGTIEHIEAAGDYMCIYTGDNSLILRETMKDLERRLDPRKFQRVHRSTIVNLDQVRQVKPHTNGECFLVLESGAEVKVSRSYRDVVARFVH